MKQNFVALFVLFALQTIAFAADEPDFNLSGDRWKCSRDCAPSQKGMSLKIVQSGANVVITVPNGETAVGTARTTASPGSELRCQMIPKTCGIKVYARSVVVDAWKCVLVPYDAKGNGDSQPPFAARSFGFSGRECKFKGSSWRM